jgi:hypothetical protein
MKQVYTDADKIAFSCCFILAVLTTATYGRWHYWWKTGFGRARMAMIAAFAGITLEHAVRSWTYLQPRSIPDHALDVIRLSSAALASVALAYLLVSTITLNIQRVRDPGFAAEQGRLHIGRTPWATEQEIHRMTTFWDEMHTRQASNGWARQASNGSRRRHLEQTPGASSAEIRELTALWDEMHSNPRLLPPPRWHTGDMPDFEAFERRNAKASHDPTLTVTVRGTLNLNEPAFTALGKPEAVVLLYAHEDAVIGLRPASRDEPNAYLTGRLGKEGKSRTIVAKDFCAWIGADLSAARRYPLIVDADGISSADLRGPVRIVTGNRQRRTPPD